MSVPSRNLALAQIRALLPSLGRSEARVAEALLDRSEEALAWPVGQVASAAGSSPATVVRTCQRLGYTGWPQLRDVLARAQEPEPAREDGSSAAAVRRMLRAGIEQLDDTLASLDDDAVEAVVDLLAGPGRLLVAASADLAPLGAYGAARFQSVGRSAEAPPDGVMLHLAARGLRPGDVCLSLATSGASTIGTRVAEAAVDAGATLVAVTAARHAPLARRAAVHLVLGTADPRPIAHQLARVRVSHMLLLDALQSALELRTGTAASRTAMYDVLAQHAAPERPGGPTPQPPSPSSSRSVPPA